MRYSQRGVTFLGWLILLVPVAIMIYAGIRLTPVYLNYMRVAHSLTELSHDTSTDDTLSARNLRAALGRHFDIESIDYPTLNDIDIHRQGDHWVAIADYQDVAPLLGNVSILVQFHKQVEVQ